MLALSATATPSFLVSVKSRLVSPFWCWLTQAVLEKWLLNRYLYLSSDKKKAKLKTDHYKTDDSIHCFAFQGKCNFACVHILAFECTLRYRRICSWTVVFRIQKTARMLASWCATSTRVAGSAVSCTTLLTVSSWRMAPIELWSYLHTAGVTLRAVAGKSTFCPSVKLVLIARAEASLGQVCVSLSGIVCCRFLLFFSFIYFLHAPVNIANWYW